MAPECSYLEPLIDAAAAVNCRSVALFGSAARRPLHEVRNVDVHVVAERVTVDVIGHLTAVAEDCARTAARGGAWRVETRHGPFAPDPDTGPLLQLHLVLDDLETLNLQPVMLRRQRIRTAVPLLGAEPPPAPGTPSRAAEELARWHAAVRAQEIPCRAWIPDDPPHLVHARVPAVTPWEQRCLSRAAETAERLYAASTL